MKFLDAVKVYVESDARAGRTEACGGRTDACRPRLSARLWTRTGLRRSV